MTTSPAAPAPAARVPLLWKLLLLVPALAHAAALGWYLLNREYPDLVEFRRLDLAVHLVVFGQLALVLFAAHSRRGTFWLLVVTYVTVAGLLGGELLARRTLPPPPPSFPRYPMRASGIPGPDFGKLAGQPYDFTVNSLGLRGPEMDFHAADVAILCLGGGTTECHYIPDQDSWPWALQDKLAERLGRTVFVGNGGMRDFGTVNVERILREYAAYDSVPRFDWVVVLCGFSDWGYKLTTTEADQLQQVRFLPFPTALIYADYKSLYYRDTGLHRLLKRSATTLGDPTGEWLPEQRGERAKLLARKRVLSKLPDDLPDMLHVYKTNLKAIHEACQAHGSKLLLLTQPTLYQKSLPQSYQKLLWRIDAEQKRAPTLDYLVEMNSKYNQAMREFCRKERVDCIDLAALKPSLFYDDCHLNYAGCEEVSEVLAGFFTKKLKGK